MHPLVVEYIAAERLGGFDEIGYLLGFGAYEFLVYVGVGIGTGGEPVDGLVDLILEPLDYLVVEEAPHLQDSVLVDDADSVIW